MPGLAIAGMGEGTWEASRPNAYLGYRRALLERMVKTHFDYGKNISLLDEFRMKNNP